MPDAASANRQYWDELAGAYQSQTRISTHDFHYGPLLAGDSELGLLPATAGARCLELGCGAGQNSIFLARGGARCVAIDVSAAQLAHGAELAAAAKVEVDFRLLSLHQVGDALGEFDLVHSVFALPFVADPAAALQLAAARLRPGGTLLLSTAHPVFAGEWLELDDAEEGMFVSDYFRPPPETRFVEDGSVFVNSRAYPLAAVFQWLQAARLRVDRLLEPQALPLPTMTEAEIRARMPYDSPAWRELYPQLARVPVVAVFRAIKERDSPR